MLTKFRSVLFALFAAVVFPVAAATKTPKGEDLFQEGVIPEIQLKLSSEGIEALSRDGSARKYVQATVREGNKTYTNVAIRLKGGPGSYRPLNDKPAFTLNFEKFAPGQTFHGLKKIHLNNSVQDRTYLHEKLSRELCDAAGVPVPRAGNAWVTLNGDELGMYVLLEGVNKQFLKRYFKDVSGNVYDGKSGNDVGQRMRVNSGDKPTDRSGMDALGAACRELDLEKRLVALDAALDIDRFLSFVAVELILGHWDGYTVGRNNFRIYHDRDSNRMVFLPHGMDQVLSSRKFPIIPQNSPALVVRSVFEIPELRTRYRARYAEIATNVFNAERMTNRMMTTGQKIYETFARHDPAAAAAYQQVPTRLSRAIERRAAALQNQISPVPPAGPAQFDGLGVVHLTNWVSKIDIGQPQFKNERDEQGNPLLQISTESLCTASWRTVVDLPPGEYRFQARIKTKGVVFPEQDPRAGAGLRISGHRAGQKNAGDRDWTPIAFDFIVPEERTETELVCELRADEGEIWYDLKSLKLIRK